MCNYFLFFQLVTNYNQLIFYYSCKVITFNHNNFIYFKIITIERFKYYLIFSSINFIYFCRILCRALQNSLHNFIWQSKQTLCQILYFQLNLFFLNKLMRFLLYYSLFLNPRSFVDKYNHLFPV